MNPILPLSHSAFVDVWRCSYPPPGIAWVTTPALNPFTNFVAELVYPNAGADTGYSVLYTLNTGLLSIGSSSTLLDLSASECCRCFHLNSLRCPMAGCS